MSNLNNKLFSIADAAVKSNQKKRDSRSGVAKGVDIAINKSYAAEDKKTAQAALRNWENTVWKPKIASQIKSELAKKAPHLKPGTKTYQQTYDSVFNKNYRDLQAAKNEVYGRIGVQRQSGQTQRSLDNDYRTREAVRTGTTKTQAVSHAARDTVEAVAAGTLTGLSRPVRAVTQLAADVGQNEDGGVFDKASKGLKQFEDHVSNLNPAYTEIQQNGSFAQKVGLGAVENVPGIVVTAGAAGLAGKGAQALGASNRVAAGAALGGAGGAIYSQSYLDGSDSTKDELANVTSEQLAGSPRSKDLYQKNLNRNIKDGLAGAAAHEKARIQTISELGEQDGHKVAGFTLATSMIAPGAGSFVAKKIAPEALTHFGRTVGNKLAVSASTGGTAAKIGIPAANVAQLSARQFAEEGLQEGFTDFKAQQTAVDVGVRDQVDFNQTKDAILIGGTVGALFGAGSQVTLGHSDLQRAQAELKQRQVDYAAAATEAQKLRSKMQSVSPGTPEATQVASQYNEAKASLDTMRSDAEKVGIPPAALVRFAPRIEPTQNKSQTQIINDYLQSQQQESGAPNQQQIADPQSPPKAGADINIDDQGFDGMVEGATPIGQDDFEQYLNQDHLDDTRAGMSEQELDAQDAQLAELIAEQQKLDEAIQDGSAEKPIEQSLAEAQAWYDKKRGVGQTGIAGVVTRATSAMSETAGNDTAQTNPSQTQSIDDYVQKHRDQQAAIDEQLAAAHAAAGTEQQKKDIETATAEREKLKADQEQLVTQRVELAQPYDSESFDTTVIGADGSPFKLSRFWDSNMPAAWRAKAIDNAFGGELDQNLAKADWSLLPEGVQKGLHQWMGGELDRVRQQRESKADELQATSGLTMPQQPIAEQPTPIATDEAAPVAATDTTPAPIQLTEDNPIINIPPPVTNKTSDELQTSKAQTQTSEVNTIYKSKPAARAAIKRQKLDLDSVTINQVKGGGFQVVKNLPTYAQAQEQAATELGVTLDDNGEYQGTDAQLETFFNRIDEIRGRSLNRGTPTPTVSDAAPVPNSDVAIGKDGEPKWFGSNDKAQAFIDKKNLSDTHEVVNTGKRFEILPKAQTLEPKAQTSAPTNVSNAKATPEYQELIEAADKPQANAAKPETIAPADTKNSVELNDQTFERMGIRSLANTAFNFTPEPLLQEVESSGNTQALLDSAGVKSIDDFKSLPKEQQSRSYANLVASGVQPVPSDISRQQIAAAAKVKRNEHARRQEAKPPKPDATPLQEPPVKIDTSQSAHPQIFEDKRYGNASLVGENAFGQPIYERGNKRGYIDANGKYEETNFKFDRADEPALINNKPNPFLRADEFDYKTKADARAEAQYQYDIKEQADRDWDNLESLERQYQLQKSQPENQNGKAEQAADTDVKKATRIKENKVFGVAQAYYETRQEKLTVEPGDVKWRDKYSDTNTVIRGLIRKGYLEKSEFDNSDKSHSALIELAIKGINAERTANGLEPVYSKSSDLKEATTTQNPKATETKAAPEDKFADNKLFTSDKVAAARARMKSKLGQVNSGFDPELLVDGMTIAGAYIESGVRKFGDYASAMIDDFGSDIKPYLLSFWEGARSYPGLDTEGMTSAADSQKQFEALKQTNQETNNDARTSEENNIAPAERAAVQEPVSTDESSTAATTQRTNASDVVAVNGRRDGRDTEPSDADSRPAETNERSDADDSNRRADRADSDDRAAKDDNGESRSKPANYRLSDAPIPAKKSWIETAEQNVNIIELIKTLDNENRAATKAEQDLLAQYNGWGASEIANGIFPNPTTGQYKSPRWQALGERLKSLLSADEYATAMRTTQYAHYTPANVVNAMYGALEKFGFEGGQVLEPASGIGVFNGLMPKSMAQSGSYVGLELDPITSRIAHHLYPQSDMKQADYTDAKLPDDHFDMAIGNPPFANITYDYTGSNKKKQKLQLHDYFFAKTLDKIKPGGILAFVTSKGTLDKKESAARQSLASQADLVGAIRLPNNAFGNAGTEVVTDIIFLKKRHEGESSNGIAWQDAVQVKTADGTTLINEYFAKHPEMVLGDNAIVSGQFGPTYTVKPNGNLDAALNDAIQKLPSNIFNPKLGSPAQAAKVAQLDFGIKSSETKEGGVYLKDGVLMQVNDGVGKPLTERYTTQGKPVALSDKDIAFLSDYVGVRDSLKQAQLDQLTDDPNWQASLDNLNQVYDAFVKKHGPLMAHTVSERINDDGSVTVTKRFKNKQRLFLDAEGVLASALENIIDDGKGTVVKGDFFKGRSLRKPKAPIIKTSQDALMHVLDTTGDVDLKEISRVTNKSESDVIRELGDQVYQDPSNGKWGLAETYLSGNVVQKLEQARKAAASNKAYQRNVSALEAVQPKPIAPNDIASNLGAAWIPSDTISQFASDILNANIQANYSAAAGLWDVSGSGPMSDFATKDKTVVNLVDAILNSRRIVVSRSLPDGGSIVDSAATELANKVAKDIKQRFKNWLWSDEARTKSLAEYYNKNYNNIVPPTFNGDHLTLAGMSNKIQMRPHQKRGIYRIVRQGDVYLNHAVGAGKTFTMIAGAMEEKRLGLINKPMFVVPNHMLDQFSQEFLMLYPAANIMVADEQNFHTHNRKQFVAKAAINAPDAIIITHSGFERIGVHPDTQKKFLEDTLSQWRAAVEDAKNAGGNNRESVKQMQRNIETMNKKLKALLDAKPKDNAVYFEDMGVDKLIVDEAHEFRKLSFTTKMGNIKGIDPDGSQAAMDLSMKLQLLREKNPTRSFVGASGTPVTNTMGELFTAQRYFQPTQLKEDSLHHFDAWANQFGEVVEGLEQNAAGNYDVVPRFAKFVNVPELMSRVRSFMDILTSQDLGDVVVRPDVKGGGRQVKAIPAPDGFSDYQETLAQRIDAIKKRSGKPEKGDDIILSVIADGRFAAIDMRFVDPTLPSDPNSKLNRAISDIAEAYHATKDNEYTTNGEIDPLKGGALMLFTDIGLGEQSAKNRGFDMKAWINSELVRLGVDPDHIAFMRDNKSHAKKGKLFDDMRQGRKRIMIGGKDMETGVNAQKRLTHLFHLDAPWFPASVEQREGRIIRQGNQNKEVSIVAYATKGSYDSTMWSMVSRKARFIEQAMKGDLTLRSMDDISEASAFEQAAALSSGDPRYMQLAGLRQDVERLSRSYSGFQNEKLDNQRKADWSKTQLDRATDQLQKIEALLPTHKEIVTGEVIGKVGGKAFDNRKDYGQAIIDEFNKHAGETKEGDLVLATAGDYDVTYHGVTLKGGLFVADVDINIPKSDSGTLFDNLNVKDVRPDGLTTRIINRVNGLADFATKMQQTIGVIKQDIDNHERRANRNFDEQTELEQKTQELQELEDALAAEAEANKNDNNLTEADAVPPKYSKTNKAKGRTSTTAKQVIDVLQKRFGKDAVARLIKSGKVRVRTLNDFVSDDGTLLVPKDAEGFYHDGKVTLIADNLDADSIVPTLLHELGGHAGLQDMMSADSYAQLMTAFDKMVEANNPLAVAAKKRAHAATDNDLDARGEYLPYLITEYANTNDRGGAVNAVKRYINRAIAAIRDWAGKTLGIKMDITANDIYQLAERHVKDLAKQDTSQLEIAGIENETANNSDADPTQVVKDKYKGTDSWLKAPNGKPTNLTEQQWLQVRTPTFKKWFGDWENPAMTSSKVVDENGEPLIVYHGTPSEFTVFNVSDIGIHAGTLDQAQSRSNEKGQDQFKIMELTMNIKNPLRLKDARSWRDPAWYVLESDIQQHLPASIIKNIADFQKKIGSMTDLKTVEGQQRAFEMAMAINKEVANWLKALGYDGIVYANTHDGTTMQSKMNADDSWIAFDPNQIKSATDNVGTFDPSNNDIRYSRRYSDLGEDNIPTTKKEKAVEAMKLGQAAALASKFNAGLLLRRHLATPLHVGMLNPSFKTFFDNIQSRIAYENNEAGRIQVHVPEIWDTRLMVGKRKAAIDKVGRALFDGTMADKVWSDQELADQFDLTDDQIDFYRRARTAVNESVKYMTQDTLSSLAKSTKLVNIHTVNRLKLNDLHPIDHASALQAHMINELQALAKSGQLSSKAEARMQQQLDDVFEMMDGIAGKFDKLVDEGYAPLMRFGHYAVEVRDKQSNELDLFELYETKGQQQKAIKELKQKYDENQFTVDEGTLNPDGFKQFTNKGLSPETIQLFAAELGLDKDGAHQAYLKAAISNRSALKRLIHRKKIPGYSEDLPRVLSSFVMSNARYSGRVIYNGEIESSIQAIKDGNLQGEAQNVFDNMENPQEEYAGVRGMLFHYYMGFSTAFMLLNFTQPFTQTTPKLTAYVGAARAHRDITQAMGIIAKYSARASVEVGKSAVGKPSTDWKGFEDNLPAWVPKDDYLRMSREGHLDPQNIWMIRGLERGKTGVISGLWGNLSRAAGWAAEVSETINRRATMIAAYKAADKLGDASLKQKGFNSKYDFVVSVIQQTQGVYNKGNRSGLARGTGKFGQFGPLVMVFKQFSINYTEQMIRHGRDKEVKSLAVAMAWQFMIAGAFGLPFADDLRDIVESMLYRIFGRATNLTAFLQDQLGEENANALMYGLLSEKTPLDMHGRSSMGNILPGTDFARPGEGDWKEVLGASSGFFENFFTAAENISKGQYKDAAIVAAPRYVRDAAAGIEIWNTGAYRNHKGDKIMDMSKTDAVIKGVGQFNPASNAKPGRARSEKYHMKNMVNYKQNQFATQLAEAMYQDDNAKIDKIYDAMDAWNDRNPEHFNIDIEKVEKSAERRFEKKDFSSDERQNLPAQLDDYFESREAG